MMLGEILSLLSLTSSVKKLLDKKTIQSDIVDIIDGSLSTEYPYFKSKILIKFFSKKEVIPIIQKIRNGENHDEELSILLQKFLDTEQLSVEHPLEMLRMFIHELEKKIVNTASPMDKLLYKYADDTNSKINQLYEKFISTTSDLSPNVTSSKNCYFNEFVLTWPKNWNITSKMFQKLTDQNVKKIFKKSILDNYDSTIIKLNIMRDMPPSELIPSVNIGITQVTHTNIDDLFASLISPFSDAGFIIYNHHIDYDENSLTLNLKIPKEQFSKYNLKEDVHQFQKYFLTNNKEYIITVTKVYESVLKKNPQITDEITSILQSFAIL